MCNYNTIVFKVTASNGLQPTSDGLQPTSYGLQPTSDERIFDLEERYFREKSFVTTKYQKRS